MEMRSAARVGLGVIAGLALVFLAWRFLARVDGSTFTIRVGFHDTHGLVRQGPVLLNGVKIGEVADVSLSDPGLRPVVTLRIQDRYSNRIPRDSRIRITSGLLIQAPQVEIEPGASSTPMDPLQVQRGAESDGMLAQMSPEADAAIRELRTTLKSIGPRLTGTLDDIRGILKPTKETMENLRVATLAAREMATDPALHGTMRSVLGDLKAVSSDARRTAQALTKEMRGLVARNGSKVDELVTSLFDLLQKFTDTVDATRGMVTALTQQVSDPRLQQGLQETLDLMKSTVARFNQIATDVHQITGDTEVQSDLKATVTTLRAAATEGKKLAEDVGRIVSRINLGSGGPRFGLGSPSLAIDFTSRGSQPHYRSDLTMRLPIGKLNAIDLGVFDLAESNKMIAQYETALPGLGAMRYGIYNSKLGIGFDWAAAPRTKVVLDAYSPNRLEVNARALLDINSDIAMWLGADNVFKRTTPVIGIRLKR